MAAFLVNTALYDLLLDLLPDYRNLKLVLKMICSLMKVIQLSPLAFSWD